MTATCDGLSALGRTRLGKLRLAADAILELAPDDLLPSPLESELYLFRDRLDAAVSHPVERYSATP